MKNILLVTELYPVPQGENMASFVCHYFAREWVKEGYNVKVIHFQQVHCWLWYWIVRHFRQPLRNHLGGLYYSYPIKSTLHYDFDGVDVYRIPIFHFIPKGRVHQKHLKRFCGEVISLMESIAFKPEIIVGHMLDLEVIPMLNEHFHTKTAMVAHGHYPKVKHRYSNYKELIESYSGWGFRAQAIKDRFEELYGEINKSFICYSGIPMSMLAPEFNRTIGDVRRFIYVGELIERKYPVELLDAIQSAMGDADYSVSYIGDGPERSRLETFIVDHHLQDKVILRGRIPRDEISKELDKADVFAMISRGEAFGLVYLEAMARGCIAIGSKYEGIDGIIKDGDNGFLVNAGNIGETASLIRKIVKMNGAERLLIAKNGYETASKMTDHNMAMDYIHKLEKL